MASFSLAFLLDIDIEYDKIKESKSLGNSSSALSFNQKVNLLLDNKSITKDEKLKLESFMNIRNQFIHNKDAVSYTKAVSNISGLENRLKRIYPDFFKEIELEESIDNCVTELYNDSLSILGDFKGGRESKLIMQSERDIYVKKYKILKEIMESEIDEVNDFIKKQESEFIKKDDLVGMIGLLKYQIIVKTNQEYLKEE
ncbi:hypothetical protein [Aurantibacter aestuarii]|nr:hypothetical protein [Aurantibacter aestuarii]